MMLVVVETHILHHLGRSRRLDTLDIASTCRLLWGRRGYCTCFSACKARCRFGVDGCEVEFERMLFW